MHTSHKCQGKELWKDPEWEREEAVNALQKKKRDPVTIYYSDKSYKSATSDAA